MTPGERERVVLEHLPLVRSAARHFIKQCPRSVDRGELESVGTLGLIEATQRFDATKGASFATFARPRIYGAMLDQMRAQAPLTRRQHERSQAPDAAFVHPHVVFNSALADRVDQLLTPTWPDPFLSRRLRAALAQLPRRLARLVLMRYWQGLTQAQIAAHLGVNESRVCQLQHAALRKLRAALAVTA